MFSAYPIHGGQALESILSVIEQRWHPPWTGHCDLMIIVTHSVRRRVSMLWPISVLLIQDCHGIMHNGLESMQDIWISVGYSDMSLHHRMQK